MSVRVEKYHHPVAARRDWETPWPLFARYDVEFGFTLDAAASHTNAKCARYFTPEIDGLVQDWGREIVWLNPPYGREIRKWMAKAHDAATRGATVVCLIPSRTDSGWWHDHVEMASERRFLRGRIKFVGAKYNAPFPCAIVIFRPPNAIESAA